MKNTCRQISALAKLALLDLYRRKDLLVALILGAVVLFPLAFFSPFGVGGANRYMDEIALLLIWVFSIVIGVGAASRLFPPEFESRTIFPLLSKPVSRGVLLLGKYLGALLAAVSALTLFYIAYAVLTGLRQGSWFPPVWAQALLLHIGFTAVAVALALLGSLVLTPSANWTLCLLALLGMLLFGQRLPETAAAQPALGRWTLGVIQVIAPHCEFFDLRQRMIHAWPAIPWLVLLCAELYAFLYTAACLALATLAFRRREL